MIKIEKWLITIILIWATIMLVQAIINFTNSIKEEGVSWYYEEESPLIAECDFNDFIDSNNGIKVTATVYNPVKSQCDSDPLVTADNSKICLKKLNKGHLRWIAISRDLRKKFKYGERVLIKSSDPKINGVWEIHDTMNPRHKRKIDLLMPSHVKKGKWEDVTISKINEKK